MDSRKKLSPAQIASTYSVIPLVVFLLGLAFLIAAITIAIETEIAYRVAFFLFVFIEVTLIYFSYHVLLLKWQIWAYNNVSDIHELDSMQGMLNELCVENYTNKEFMLSKEDIAARNAIIAQYKEPYKFFDDPEVSENTKGRFRKLDKQVILTNDGIVQKDIGFYPWEEITDENIFLAPSRTRKGKSQYLDYTSPGGEVSIDLLDIGVDCLWLKHALYVYRMRYSMQQGHTKNANNAPLLPATYSGPIFQLSYQSSFDNFWQFVARVSYRMSRISKMAKMALFAPLFFAMAYALVNFGSFLSREVDLKKHFEGIVNYKGVDNYRRRTYIFRTSENGYDIRTKNAKIFDTLNVGDYIIKKKGQSKITIVKGADSLVLDNEEL